MSALLSQRVQRSFSRSFHSYHEAACPQARIADLLVGALARAGAPARFGSVLELGCGTGHLTARLQRQFECPQMTLNDLSPAACQTARQYGATFLCGDALALDWPEVPSLIASASMIQWLPDPLALVRRAARALPEGGWLALSGFGPGHFRELSALGSQAQAPGLCPRHALAAAVAPDLDVLACGEDLSPLYFPSPREVLRHLRRTGVNGQARQSWTRARLARFEAAYRQQFGTAQGVSLTYQAVWIVARKPVGAAPIRKSASDGAASPCGRVRHRGP
ncbi:methyltransferase domain-containing protein [Thioclava sp. GXIMD4215]|uniref:methyltransferase domain-containing protein n=1 Tax=Thioclava sp. GXIMD4215 TaxID=3131928 RepID=UPI00311AE3EC